MLGDLVRHALVSVGARGPSRLASGRYWPRSLRWTVASQIGKPCLVRPNWGWEASAILESEVHATDEAQASGPFTYCTAMSAKSLMIATRCQTCGIWRSSTFEGSEHQVRSAVWLYWSGWSLDETCIPTAPFSSSCSSAMSSSDLQAPYGFRIARADWLASSACRASFFGVSAKRFWTSFGWFREWTSSRWPSFSSCRNWGWRCDRWWCNSGGGWGSFRWILSHPVLRWNCPSRGEVAWIRARCPLVIAPSRFCWG